MRNLVCSIAAMLCIASTFMACSNSTNEESRNVKEESSVRTQGQDTLSVDSVSNADKGNQVQGTDNLTSKIESVSLTSKEFKDSKKKAVIIAVSRYKGDWEPLSCFNDVKYLDSVLKKSGFTVTIVQNDDATHAGIKDSLKKVIKNCHEGDMVLVHFSGHGQQIEGGDQSREPDRKAESFVAFDAYPKCYKNIYDGSGHLSDDEIHNIRNEIRKRIRKTGFLMMTFDACHSAGSTDGNRGIDSDIDIIRGTNESIVIPNFKPEPLRIKDNAPDLSPFIELSACQEGEINFEYVINEKKNERCGSLSYLMYLSLKDGFTDFNGIKNYVMNNYKKSKCMMRQKPYAYSTS